jgi:hypothetical protein
MTKRLKTPEEVKRYFPGFLSAFIDSISEQQVPRPANNRERSILFRQIEKKTYGKDTDYG